MANTVEITVKVNNKTDFDPLKDALLKIGSMASDAGEKVTQGLGEAGDAAASTAAKFGENAAAAFVMNAASTAASGGINAIVSAYLGLLASIPAVIGAFLALAPAIAAIGGAAGAAISGLVGVGLTLATLKIGFGGIGAALTAHNQQMGGAGKAASNTAAQEKAAAERIVQASRTLRDAKEQEKQASEDVTKAIAAEIDRRKQLSLDLESAAAAANDAKQAVVEAEEKNRRAQAAGSDWEKAEAANALADAKADYDQRVAKVQSLTKEKDKAAKTSVQQSDQVQAALAKEKDAQERVSDATHDLAVAKQKDAVASAGAAGGVNAFADAMDKLSPNARKLVYALIAIEDRFQAIKKRVQDRLLDGFDKSVTDLANVWLPKLDGLLGGIADHLNGLGKAWAKALGDSTFVKNIQTMGHAFEGFIDNIKGIGVDLTDAFGRIGAAASPVLKVIGDFIEGIADHFDRWIKSADDSGKLDKFMQSAAKTLQQIFDIFNDLITVAADFIEILYPDSAKDGGGALDAIDKALKSIHKWLTDKDNQQKIQNFMDSLQGIYDFVVHDLGPIFVWLGKVVIKAIALTVTSVRGFITALHAIRTAASSAGDYVTSKWDSVANRLKKIGSNLSSVLSRSWDGLKQGFRNVLNWVIGKWNGLNFTLPGILGGGSYGVGSIPYMATGGIANGLTMINEKGAELVKLPSGSMVYPHGQSAGMADRAAGNKGGGTTLYIERSGNDLVDVLIEAIAGKIRKRGGDVQVVLGTRKATTT